MKTIHEVGESTQFPPFWNEEWLQVAIQELDKRAFTPEERLRYEMTISAKALAIKHENKKIEQAQLAVKTETVKNLLALGVLSASQIAQTVGVSEEFVRSFSSN